MTLVRRAKLEDCRGIHDAHLHSIQRVCAKDHSVEEIAAWGGRAYSEEKWMSAINLECAWVVEVDARIEGYGHLHIFDENEKKVGFIDEGSQVRIEIGGAPVRCFPMAMSLI